MPASLTSDRGERKNSFVKLWIIRVKWGLSVDSKPALAIRGCGLEGVEIISAGSQLIESPKDTFVPTGNSQKVPRPPKKGKVR